MTKFGLLAGTAIVAFIAATAAVAADDWRPDHGWYGAIDLGGSKSLPVDLAASPAQTGDSDGFSVRSNYNFAGMLRLGYRISPHFRLEVEGGYRRGGITSFQDFKTTGPNDIDVCASGSAGDPNCGSPSGSVNAWTGMVNGLVDLFPNWRLSPFVGGGVGFVNTKVSATGTLVGDLLPPPGAPVSFSQSQTKFAYQGIGGVSYHAGSNLDIDLTYRYLGSSKMSVPASVFGVPSSPNDPAPLGYSGSYRNSTVTLGVLMELLRVSCTVIRYLSCS